VLGDETRYSDECGPPFPRYLGAGFGREHKLNL